LAKAGVTRVVVALRDPNPGVAGKGISLLKRARIKTSVGLFERQAGAVNADFLSRMSVKRPRVILKAALSLDGKAATDNGKSKWITSGAARKEGHRLRATVDAILVGVGTVLADDPSLTSHGAGRNPVRVILDSRGRTLGTPGPRTAKRRPGSSPPLPRDSATLRRSAAAKDGNSTRAPRWRRSRTRHRHGPRRGRTDGPRVFFGRASLTSAALLAPNFWRRARPSVRPSTGRADAALLSAASAARGSSFRLSPAA